LKTIHLAPGLSLPLDIVTQTVGILAKRRAGKSYLARRLAEQLLKAGQQIVIVDPKGDWWGIRSAADGKAPGFPVTILGGERGDLPLEAPAGEVIAKLVVMERADVLLDLSLFRKHEVATFMTGFLENLYRLKAREEYRTPVMLLIDEADAVAPQKPQKGEERMLGAAEDIVRRGGQRGIGATLITQRSAVLNKNVLTQAQILIGLRTIAPQDLAALDAWIDVHGTAAQRKTLMESLPSLPQGDAWVWSPGWPTDVGIFQRIHTSAIETFDSGATPKPGEKRQEPKAAAEIDLEALRRQMAATIERAKADDPRELRRQIADLQKQLKGSAPAAAPPAAKVREVPVLKDAQVKRLEGSVQMEITVCGRLDAMNKKTLAALESMKAALRDFTRVTISASGSERVLTSRAIAAPRPAPVARQAATPRHLEGNGQDLVRGELAILTAIAQHGDDGVTREQLTVLTGYKRSSRDTYLQRLMSASLVGRDGDRLIATHRSTAVLGPDFETLPTGDALREHWLRRLPEGERRILDRIIEAYPDPVDRDMLSESTGYKRSSRDTYLQRLFSRRLVVAEGRGAVRASAILFS
jgi:hypothetical protein